MHKTCPPWSSSGQEQDVGNSMQGQVAGPSRCAQEGKYEHEISRGADAEEAATGGAPRPRRGDHLDGSHLRGQAEAAVIAVGHHDAADEARADPPRCLVHELLGVVLVDERRAERLGKVLSQVVAGTSLQPCRMRAERHARTRRWNDRDERGSATRQWKQTAERDSDEPRRKHETVQPVLTQSQAGCKLDTSVMQRCMST